MKYVGGKSKIAKDILPIILANRKENQTFVDICCGGGGILDKVANPRIANDINYYVVALLEAVKNGWIPPDSLSETEYKDIKNNPTKYLLQLVGFAAIPCSYAAKFWGGYARGFTNKGVARNYALEAKKHLLKQAKLLQGVQFCYGSYDEVPIPPNSIIYADIPYSNTVKYAGTPAFDYEKFWKWADEKVDQGHSVFVSEYVCPLSHWKSVWQKEVCSSLTKETGSKKAIEQLWTRAS